MIIHSIMPEDFLREKQNIPEGECISFDKGFIMGVRDDKGVKISRIISTDPSVYLDSKFSPGEYYK